MSFNNLSEHHFLTHDGQNALIIFVAHGKGANSKSFKVALSGDEDANIYIGFLEPFPDIAASTVSN